MIEELEYRIALKPCPHCLGAGVIRVSTVDTDVGREYGEWIVCPECGGEGNRARELEDIE